MTYQVALYGIGSPLLVDYEESARRAGLSIAFGVRNVDGESYLASGTPVYAPAAVSAGLREVPILVPIFTPGFRQAAAADAADHGFAAPMILIDPTAVLPRAIEFGTSLFVNAGCVLGAGSRIGSGTLINRGANIGHHARFGDFVSIGPGAVIAGCVTLGDGVVIGAGAIVLPEVTIGANAVVGAGSVVTHDVDPNCLVLGNPARVVRRDTGGYNGVRVV